MEVKTTVYYDHFAVKETESQIYPRPFASKWFKLVQTETRSLTITLNVINMTPTKNAKAKKFKKRKTQHMLGKKQRVDSKYSL